MRQLLLILGSALPLLSSVTYIVSILKGKSRPQRMTRILMLTIGALSLASLWAAHDTSGIWLALVSLIQAAAILSLSFKRGMGGRGRLDFICLGLCLAGCLLWWISGQSLLGLMASIVADVIACVPSLHKTMRWPQTESLLFYLLDTIAGALILLAGPYEWQAMLFPAYIILINFVFVAVIKWPRWALAEQPVQT